jgi:hypothetical protein
MSREEGGEKGRERRELLPFQLASSLDDLIEVFDHGETDLL